ncbi:EfeM/EfeO family lipoprotein [Oligella urethralis]|uniref:Imelysin-like domain-containing protein n=3 Tax=Oligella urethralis TaxID=90245 RepID=A0A095YSR3_9BURK|nr:EfeM/EfeO family lipoprotein [Oligella urethralis]KGF25450.1 hypothetical protein HMPREF2130_11135 [Oligella urethralis DNF00040]SPY07891.1 Iron uptake system component EfeO precursor [Oligella urethralis]SUA54261.1 Iron uptake system component EfeO precursor [Oligella urethralis]
MRYNELKWLNRPAKAASLTLLVAALLVQVMPAHAIRAPVLNTGDATAAKGDIPTPQKFIPAIEAYMQYMASAIEESIAELTMIVELAESAALAEAKPHYIRAHQAYERIRPALQSFGFIDDVVNTRADYYLDREANPNFKGYHRVEYDIFVLADEEKTIRDTQDLLYQLRDVNKRIAIETLEIVKLVQSAADFMEMILEKKLLGIENQYAGSDLADIQANIDGSRQVVSLLAPFIDEPVMANITAVFERIQHIMDNYREGEGFKQFNQLNAADKARLYSLVTEQAQQLAELRALLDIEVYFKYKSE